MEDIFTGTIYQFKNISDGKVYIGQCRGRSPYTRKKEHYRAAKSGKKGKLYEAMRTEGLMFFEFEVIETITKPTIEELKIELNRREIFHINQNDSLFEGYNSTAGGQFNC